MSKIMRFRECRTSYFKTLSVLLIASFLFLASCSSEGAKNNHISRGEELLKKRKFQEASMEFRAAVDIDNNSAEAHWGLARAHEGMGKLAETIEELRQVILINPNNLEAKGKLGNYFLLFTPPQVQEAEKMLEEIFAADPNFIEGHILKASIMSVQNKPEKQILDVLNHAISLDASRIESYLSLSRFYMKLNKPADAENTIKKAISVNEKSVLARLEYARFLTFSGRKGDAEAEFKKAVEIDPADIEARESIAGFYLAERQIEKAEQAYKELVEAQGNIPEAKKQLADFYALIGREDEAIKVFEEIIGEAPRYAQARYRLSEIYLERKELDRVNAQIEELLAMNDTDAEALMLRARVKMQDNNAEGAIKDLEEVLKKQPSLKAALYYMTQARLSLGQIDQARAFIGDLERYHPGYLYSKLLKVQASFAADEFDVALRQSNELLDTLKTARPTAETTAQEIEELRFRAISARGMAHLGLNKLNEARADFKEVLRLSPNSAIASINLAKVELAASNYGEAMSLFEKALNADKKNFEALTGIVNVHKMQKQFGAAHDRIAAAMKENEGQKTVLPAMHYLNAEVYLAENNLQGAEAEFKKAIEIDGEYLPAYSGYAALLIMQNQTDQAIAQYKKVVEKKPSSSVYTLIGMLEDGRQNLDEAEKNYRKALEITPETPIAANNLAWLIAANDRGNLDEALQLAETTVSKNSGNAGFYDTLGWVYYKKGLYTQAVDQLKKAVSLNEAEASRVGAVPNPAYRLRLGMAMVSAGDRQNARKEIELALKGEKNLSENELQEARKLLGNL